MVIHRQHTPDLEPLGAPRVFQFEAETADSDTINDEAAAIGQQSTSWE